MALPVKLRFATPSLRCSPLSGVKDTCVPLCVMALGLRTPKAECRLANLG